jgi:DNA-binding LacI/PurR family transcriptional regulator
MSTVKDIASHTGLAVTTVSEILRNKPGYRADTRRRVLDAAGHLRYEPNLIGQALKRGRTMSVGVIFPTISRWTFGVRAEAVENTLREAGYLSLMTPVASGFDQPLLPAIRNLVRRQVDGLVIYREIEPAEEVRQYLDSLTIPVVYMGSPIPGCTNQVSLDRQVALTQAAEHLAGLGHRRVAYLPGRFDWDHPGRKIEAYRRACDSCGTDLLVERQWTFDTHTDSREVLVRNLGRLLEVRPAVTALLTNNDDGAFAALNVLGELGAAVPGRMSLVGFGDPPLASLLRPALTTIYQPLHEVGRAAAQMIRQLIERPGEPVQPITFPYRLIVRHSTGPAPRGETHVPSSDGGAS